MQQLFSGQGTRHPLEFRPEYSGALRQLRRPGRGPAIDPAGIERTELEVHMIGRETDLAVDTDAVFRAEIADLMSHARKALGEADEQRHYPSAA
jgi:hypothetical protein